MKTRFLQGNLKKTYGKNSNGAIKYIVIHETDNNSKGANADAHARLQLNNSRDASWHYQVDDREIVQSFTHDVSCWHAGKGNRGSIAIELCVNGGFNMKAFNNMLILVAQLKKQYPSAQIVQHNHFTGKHCPRNIREKNIWNQVLNHTTINIEESGANTMKKLSPTAQKDMVVLLQHAYDTKIFSVNHVSKVKDMTIEEAFDLLVSYNARTVK